MSDRARTDGSQGARCVASRRSTIVESDVSPPPTSWLGVVAVVLAVVGSLAYPCGLSLNACALLVSLVMIVAADLEKRRVPRFAWAALVLSVTGPLVMILCWLAVRRICS